MSIRHTKKIGLIASLCALFAGVSMASPVSVSPDSFQTDMVAGETVTRDVTVEWNGDMIKYISLDTSVAANTTDTIGFDASLNRSSLVLTPGEQQSVELAMDADSALVPDVFEVNVTANAKVMTDETNPTGTEDDEVRRIVEESYNESLNKTEQLNQTINRLEEELERREEANEQKNNRINNLENAISTLEQSIAELNQTNGSTETGETAPPDTDDDTNLVDILVGFIMNIF